MSLYNGEASVVCLSVRLSVNFCANRFFSHANGRIATKLSQDGLQVSVHPGCAQGQGRGQRSRDTRTFLDSWNELGLLRHWRSSYGLWNVRHALAHWLAQFFPQWEPYRWPKLNDATLHFFACSIWMHLQNFMIFGTHKLHKATMNSYNKRGQIGSIYQYTRQSR